MCVCVCLCVSCQGGSTDCVDKAVGERGKRRQRKINCAEEGRKKRQIKVGRNRRAEGEMTLMMMRWKKAWRGIKADDRQREGKIDL